MARNALPERTSVSSGPTAMLCRGEAALAGSPSRYTLFCFGWMLVENVPLALSESLASAVVHGWPGPSCTRSETRWCGSGHTRPVSENRVPAIARVGPASVTPTIRK